MSKYGFSSSWKRAFGISAAKQSFAQQTGIQTTQSGLERKWVGGLLVHYWVCSEVKDNLIIKFTFSKNINKCKDYFFLYSFLLGSLVIIL